MNLIRLLGLCLLMSACGSSTEKQQVSGNNKDSEKDSTPKCTYSFVEDSTEVLWTAYKFTEKVGVSGTFETAEIEAINQGKTPKEVMKGMGFMIPVNSVNTNNPDRDAKIREYFFGSLEETEFLSGTIKEFQGNNKGTATAFLSMNNRDEKVQGKYSIDDAGNVEFTGELDVSHWEAMRGIDAINEVCEELHRGEDGESVLWPDVSFTIRGFLRKDCP